MQKINSLFYPLFIVCSITFSSATTLAECKAWQAQTTYTSQEGFLQIFLQAMREGKTHSALLTPDILNPLSNQIHTLFPLQDTRSIQLIDSVLTMEFNGPVSVKVPGTWRQATLTMSPEVVFIVHPILGPIGAPYAGVEFEIVKGQVTLEFGWLARKIQGMPATMQGKHLRYWSDDAHAQSTISLEQVQTFAAKDISIQETPTQISIAYSPTDTIRYTDSSAHYFGIDLHWSGDSLYTPEHKWVHDARTVESLRAVHKEFHKILTKTQGHAALVLTNALIYQLEVHRGSLSKGFSLQE